MAPGRPGLRQPPARLPVAVEVAVVDQPADGFPYAATALRIAIKAEMPGFGRQDESVGHRLMVRNEGPSVEVLQGIQAEALAILGKYGQQVPVRRLSEGCPAAAAAEDAAAPPQSQRPSTSSTARHVSFTMALLLRRSAGKYIEALCIMVRYLGVTIL